VRAITVEQLGGADRLRLVETEVPNPAPTEVLVRVHAAGVNPVDWKTREGRGVAGVLGAPPWTLGWDVSGVVETVGPGVTRFVAGDEVFGMPRFPHAASAYAEYVAAPSRHLARKPAALTHEEAAGLPLAGLTAWQALVETAAVSEGQRVLVHAAAGGVGHLAVQLAHWRGAHVLGTASTAKHGLLRALGADELIDYRTHEFEEEIAPVDLVLDMGSIYGDRSLRVLRPGGVLITGPGDGAVATSGEHRVAAMLVEPDGHALERLAELVEAGDLRVHVSATADLADAAKLHVEGQAGRLTGKTVLRCSRYATWQLP
jgi:NADPH:quinone reductase-like Zn-dependent oxidoreductase